MDLLNWLRWGIILGICISFFHCKNTKPNSMSPESVTALSSGNLNDGYGQTPIDPPTAIPIIPAPAGFGSNGPEVRYLFIPNSVDRYKPLELQFSEAMDASTVAGALHIRNVTTDTSVNNYTLRWTSPVNLSIRIGQELGTNQEYEIELTTFAKSTNLNLSLQYFKQSFQTDKTIQLERNLVVNGTTTYPVSSEKGIIIDKNQTTSIRLDLHVNFPEETKEILLCKLGETHSTNPLAVICSSIVAIGVQICKQNCQTYSYYDLLHSSVIPPKIGTNLYFIRIESISGQFSYFSVNFLYGEVATDSQSKITNVANLLIGQNQGINAISELITRYAKGNFTLYDTDSQTDKTLNQFIQKKTSVYPGGNCLLWPTPKLSHAPTPSHIDYLATIGPFCGIEVEGSIFESITYPNVNYKAKADIYITSLVVEETSFPSGDTNLNFQFDVQNGIFDINVFGKKLKGKFAIVIKVEEIEFFDYLLANTLVYYGESIPGTDGDEVGFAINEDPPVEISRRAFVRSNLLVNSLGKISLQVNPFNFPTPFLSNTDCLDLPNHLAPTALLPCNPFVTHWANHIKVNQVTGTGAVAAIVADVINQEIPRLKNKIVQNVLKDITERVTPEILNNLLGQLDNGILVHLPDYLPNPLNKVTLKLNANLKTDTSPKSISTHFGIEGSLDVSLLSCVKDNLNRCPWNLGYIRPTFPKLPYGTASFIKTKSNVALPSNLERASDNPGVLMKLHSDLINQALYHLWWNGGFNFEVDQGFIETINQFVGSSSLLRLTTSILKADPIVTIFAPGQNNLTTSNGVIFANDDIVLSLLPIHPIFLGFSPLSGTSDMEEPKLQINLADLEITIKGKKTDPTRPNCPSTDCKDGSIYTIAKVRLSLTSKSNLSFGTYSLPNCTGNCFFSNSVIASIGNPSLKIVTSKDVGDLYYLIEPIEGATQNPLALRPSGIKEIVNPLVKSLIIPLINNITRDIPLPKIRACGLDLYDLETLPISGNTNESYLQLHTKVQNILFTGSCRL